MKISPDYKGRDDQYDKHTVRYYEELSESGDYFYELYVLINRKKAAIMVAKDFVVIEWRHYKRPCRSHILTNITPGSLFPNERALAWTKLHRIIKILEQIEIEGKSFRPKKIDAVYEEWRSHNPVTNAPPEDEGD
jgi:hypothetical protein